MVELFGDDTVILKLLEKENRIPLLSVDTPKSYGEGEPGEQRASIVKVMCKNRGKG